MRISPTSRAAAWAAFALTAMVGAASAGSSRTLGADAAAESVTHVLAARLRSSGRGEVRIERLMLDPISGRTQAVRGTLALEPPDRASLEFPATGERLALRSDGGEWLQPELRQMIRLDREKAADAARWWQLLVRERPAGFPTRRVGERRWLVFVRHGSSADSAWVTLATDGLPIRLEVDDAPGVRAMYRFRDWKFMRPRGRGAFIIRPPRDYVVVPLQGR